MKMLLLILGALLFFGDLAHAQGFELSSPLYYRNDLHYTQVRDASASREPLKRAIEDLAGSTSARVTRAWTYAELAGAQTTCGVVEVNGRSVKFVLQRGPRGAASAFFAKIDVPEFQFLNAGCDRERAALIIPPQF